MGDKVEIGPPKDMEVVMYGGYKMIMISQKLMVGNYSTKF